jgi:amino acid adenylation domain-containing protein
MIGELVRELAGLGVELRVDGDQLRCTAPRGALTPALLERLRGDKHRIIDYLRSRDPEAPGSIARISRQQGMPLGYVQQRMWLLDRMDPDSTASNLPGSWRLHGTLDVAAFRAALTEVVRRHEVLRTRIAWDGHAPLQYAEAELIPDLPVIDLTGLADDARHAELLRRFEEDRARVFDLQQAPLFRARLYRMRHDEHVFFFMPHHVIWDGWSFDILLSELSTLYDAFSRGKPSPLPELRVQYADYASWHRDWMGSDDVARQREFWRERLKKPLPVLELPTLLPRPAVMSQTGRRSLLPLDASLVDRLRTLGREEGATLFMVLLAAYKAFLRRYTGQRDIIVGAPVQDRIHVDAERMIGVFVNTLVLRTTVDDQRSFRELLCEVRDGCVAAYDNQSVPFDQLVEDLQPERSLSHTPIYQTLFTFQETTDRPTRFGDLTVSQLHVPTHSAPTDVLYGVMASERATLGLFDFNADLFDQAAAERFTAGYRTLLESAVRAADAPLATLDLVPPAERHLVLDEFNATARSLPALRTIDTLIAGQVERHGDRTAVEDAQTRWSYAELDARATQIAAQLRAAGVGQGELVGICLERSVDLVAAVLAVWKAGGAYVPLDPEYPADRTAYVLSDSGARCVVSSSTLRAGLPAHVAIVSVDDGLVVTPAVTPDARTPSRVAESGLAYVIYTSGSTGQPKGVAIPHAALINFCSGMVDRPGFLESDSILAVTTLSFDISLLELVLPLTVGARIVVASANDARDPDRLVALLATHRPSVMQATPATWRALLDAGWSGARDMRALCGGEALPRDLAQRLAPVVQELWNMYGPTETTVWSTCGRISPDDQRTTVGRPIANTSVHILDEHGQLVPIGVAGEAYIGGLGVAAGYLHQPERTAERFVPSPLDPDQRVYRTGDRMRWWPDGQLEHLGRLDRQVKIRGFRIEPGEIETVLMRHADVRVAVVDVRPGPNGAPRLIAYVITHTGESLPLEEMRAHLRRSLPEYMVPAVVMTLPDLPYTPNGKIDRNALPEPGELSTARTHEPPQSDVERVLARMWKDLIHVDAIGRLDDFFELGGDSLLAMRVVARIRRDFQVDIPVRLIFENPTIERLGLHVEDAVLASMEAMTDEDAGGLVNVRS